MGVDPKLVPTICVIGGSAAGMTAAIFAARFGERVILIEGNDKLGRKIYATGNGKCNFYNRDQDYRHFHTSGDASWISEILDRKENTFVLDFFRELGLMSIERHGGYYYPVNESAATVVACLEEELQRLHVEIILKDRMRTLTRENGGFRVLLRSGSSYYADAVILAMGGSASPKLGSDGSGYYYAKNFGHTIVEPLPALCPLKLEPAGTDFSVWSGVRLTDASITLLVDGVSVASERGEILLTAYGVSGIPVFQISGIAAVKLAQKKNVNIQIDAAPDMGAEEAKQAFSEWKACFGKRTLQEQLSRIFPTKMVEAFYRSSDRNTPMAKLDDASFAKAFDCFKHMTFTVLDTMGFDQAQVSSGGVSLSEVSPQTMESKLRPGLYFAGELLDVYGDCGGYNLQFAFTGGAIAGQSAAEACTKAREGMKR